MATATSNSNEDANSERTLAIHSNRKERKRLQNRIAQRTYRRNQRQRLQALQAAVTWSSGFDMLPSPPEQAIGDPSSSIAGPPAIDFVPLDNASWNNPSPPPVLPPGLRDNRTPLHVAAANGSIEMTKLLLERGANIDSQDASLKTALHIAAERGQTGVVELLLSQSADPAKTDLMGRTALFPAVECGDETLVNLLLGSTVDVNVVDVVGKSALHLAVARGSLSMATRLLDCRANVDARAEE